jgi:cytochrome o ubiquinol oxidase subunit 2
MVLIGLFDLAVLIATLLRGHDVALFHPKGLIAQQELRMIIISGSVLCLIGIPAVLLFYFFAWKYRETNEKAVYNPHNHHGRLFIITIWTIPCIFMFIMSTIMWSATHKLDPHTPIASTTKPLVVEVVAMRWKWLFIYPEQHIAAVNYVMLPKGTPVRFELTADEAPMSSFWIPHLSGQLYAMTGHVNELNILPDTPGDYQGSSAEINGAGFAGMKFMAHVDTTDTFDQWVSATRESSAELTGSAYQNLLHPSENNSAAYYANPAIDLYNNVVMKYAGSHTHHTSGVESE